MLDQVDKRLLAMVADLHAIPQGAYNIRKDGAGAGRRVTAHIDIRTKTDKPGIDIIVRPGTREESVHIPVILAATGVQDVVYNTFDIGEDSDILVVAGCGIHNTGSGKSQHDGIHEFVVRRGARMRYVEKHYGEGEGKGEKVLNPTTILRLEEGAIAELELVQIRGIDNTKRVTEANLAPGAYLMVTERMLTHGRQFAESHLTVNLKGAEAVTRIISRSVARDESEQLFYPRVAGYQPSRGHVQCDAIIMDRAQVRAIPEIAAYHADARLVHEAAIGRIEGEQLIKLMSLGLTEKEAEEAILQGFLK